MERIPCLEIQKSEITLSYSLMISVTAHCHKWDRRLQHGCGT